MRKLTQTNAMPLLHAATGVASMGSAIARTARIQGARAYRAHSIFVACRAHFIPA